MLIDLLDLFEGVPPKEVETMFIPQGALAYRGAAGHYTVKGNQHVAQALLERLQQLPAWNLSSELPL